MTRLFINLYLDEDVSALIATLIKTRGLVAVTTNEAGHSGNADALQLAFAAERRMAILTHNRDDFLELAAEYRATNRHHSGIIIAVRRSPYVIASRLLRHLDEVSADEMDDQVYFI